MVPYPTNDDADIITLQRLASLSSVEDPYDGRRRSQNINEDTCNDRGHSTTSEFSRHGCVACGDSKTLACSFYSTSPAKTSLSSSNNRWLHAKGTRPCLLANLRRKQIVAADRTAPPVCIRWPVRKRRENEGNQAVPQTNVSAGAVVACTCIDEVDDRCICRVAAGHTAKGWRLAWRWRGSLYKAFFCLFQCYMIAYLPRLAGVRQAQFAGNPRVLQHRSPVRWRTMIGYTVRASIACLHLRSQLPGLMSLLNGLDTICSLSFINEARMLVHPKAAV